MPPRQPRLSDVEFGVLAAFRLELRRYLNFAETQVDARGLTMQQHQAMLAIRASTDRRLSVKELSEIMLLRHNTTVELADRLERGGFILRMPDPADGRRALLTLSRTGEKALAGLAAAHMTELRDQGPKLIKALKAVMERAEAEASAD